MTGFDLLANYHPDPESLLRKSYSRLSSLGSSASRIREIIDQFQGSTMQVEPVPMAARKCINDFWLRPVPTFGLVQRRMSEMVTLSLSLHSSIWCSKAHSVGRLRRMPMPIFSISWRSPTHSASEESPRMRMSLPFSILVIGEGKAVVLRQQGSCVHLGEVLQCILRNQVVSSLV
jgi:hypothetical protein